MTNTTQHSEAQKMGKGAAIGPRETLGLTENGNGGRTHGISFTSLNNVDRG